MQDRPFEIECGFIELVRLPNQTAKPKTTPTETVFPPLTTGVIAVLPIVGVLIVPPTPLLPQLQAILSGQLAVNHRADLPPVPLTVGTARLDNTQTTPSNRNLLLPGTHRVARIPKLSSRVLLIDLPILLPHSLQKPFRSLRNRIQVAGNHILTALLVSPFRTP